MSVSENLFIEGRKLKLGVLVLGAFVFVGIGIWMISADQGSHEGGRRSPDAIVVIGVGVAAILFFGLCAILGLMKLLDQASGLILSPAGLLDNSSALSVGFVPWSEVIGIGCYQLQKQKFVAVYVADTEKYMNCGNRAQRIVKRANIGFSGTPINISASSLKISHEALFEAIQAYLQAYRQTVLPEELHQTASHGQPLHPSEELIS